MRTWLASFRRLLEADAVERRRIESLYGPVPTPLTPSEWEETNSATTPLKTVRFTVAMTADPSRERVS